MGLLCGVLAGLDGESGEERTESLSGRNGGGSLSANKDVLEKGLVEGLDQLVEFLN